MDDENIQEQDLSEDGAEPQKSDSENPEQVSIMENVPQTDSSELYAEILTEIKTGNEILGKMYAVEVFILAFMLFLFVYLIIKNNVTKHY